MKRSRMKGKKRDTDRKGRKTEIDNKKGDRKGKPESKGIEIQLKLDY